MAKKKSKKSASRSAGGSRSWWSVGAHLGVAGVVSAVLSFFFVPILFGIIGIALGHQAVIRGRKGLGWTAMILSVVLAVVGTVLGGYWGYLLTL